MMRCLTLCLALSIVPFAGARAPAPVVRAGDPQDRSPELSAAELDRVLGPIALYPDDVLATILVAANYVSDVIAASQWFVQNQAMMQPTSWRHAATVAKQTAAAIDGQVWDPSVKLLTQYETVLHGMARRPDATHKLGVAFETQQADVMQSIQRLRAQAQDAGSLTTTARQKVIQDQGTIVIQPNDPSAVYLPSYNASAFQGGGAGAPSSLTYQAAPSRYECGYREYQDYYGLNWGYGAYGGVWLYSGDVDVDVDIDRGFAAQSPGRRQQMSGRPWDAEQASSPLKPRALGVPAATQQSRSARAGAGIAKRASAAPRGKLAGPVATAAGAMSDDYGRASVARQASNRGRASRAQPTRQAAPPKPRPLPQRQANAFQGYGNGNRARLDSQRGQASRGRGGGPRGGR